MTLSDEEPSRGVRLATSESWRAPPAPASQAGAVVLADTRRLLDSFAAIEYFELRRIPFVVAVNEFDGAFRYTTEEVRDALEVKPEVPVMLCDARSTSSCRRVLISLVEHARAMSLAARSHQ